MNWLYIAGGVSFVFILIVVAGSASSLSPDQCYYKFASQGGDATLSTYYPDGSCNAIRTTDYFEKNYFVYHDFNWHLKSGVQSYPQPDINRAHQIQQVAQQRSIQTFEQLAKFCLQIGCLG